MLLRELEPDVIDWAHGLAADRAEFMRSRGVAVTTDSADTILSLAPSVTSFPPTGTGSTRASHGAVRGGSRYIERDPPQTGRHLAIQALFPGGGGGRLMLTSEHQPPQTASGIGIEFRITRVVRLEYYRNS